MLEYAEKLTLTPTEITEADVQRLRDVGFGDEEILNICVATAYRGFINRVRDGLGVGFEDSASSLDERLRAAVALGTGRPVPRERSAT
jgi:hypothetical protein